MNLLCPNCKRFLCQQKETLTGALRFPCPRCGHHTTFEVVAGEVVATRCVESNARVRNRVKQQMNVEADLDRLRFTAQEIRLVLLGLKRSLLALEPRSAEMDYLHTIARRRQEARAETLSRLTAIEQRASAARANILAYVETLPHQCSQEALAHLDELQQGWPRVQLALSMARKEIENGSAFASVAVLDLPGWNQDDVVRVVEIFPLHNEQRQAKQLANAVA